MTTSTPALYAASGERWAPRVLVATTLVSAGILLVACHEMVRTWEAMLSARWLDGILAGGADPVGVGIYVRDTPAGGLVFQITPECTVVVLVAPMLLFGAALALHRRTGLARALWATVAGCVLLTVVNQFRIGLIIWATQQWGLDPGYEISHKLVGSVIGIGGFVGAVIVALVIVGAGRKQRAR